jgi:hypothetical protein
MTYEELKELHNELTIIADRPEALILSKWLNAFKTSNKFHELGEAVETHFYQGNGLACMQGLTVWW